MTLRTTTARAGLAILLVTAGTSLAACGSSSTPAAKAPSTRIEGVNVANATTLNKKPIIDIPDVLPPAGLIKKDIVVGKGAVVKSGDSLTAAYVGVSWSTNKQFDASWDRPQKTIPFTLAKGSVIDGWTAGLPGMRVGGRRMLIVPPAQGYGDQGQGTSIPGGETLVFIVDATKTAKAPATPPSTASSGGSALTQAQLQAAIAQSQASGGSSSAPGTAAPAAGTAAP